MRLHHLKMTAFGPFPGTVEVPFEELEQGGAPFLLTGPTGSGKTTILDAVCFALYGRVPRAGQSPDVASRHRDPNTTPSVELELSIGSERLKVVRIPTHMRENLKTPSKHRVTVSLLDGEGTWVDLATSIDDAKTELEVNRLRMDESQFGQVVMLPQGEFARFLDSTPKDRKALLQRLFPGEDLGAIQDWLKAKAEAAENARDECHQRLEVEIGKVWAEVTDAARNRGEEDPEVPDALDTVSLLGRLEEAKAPLEAEKARAEAEEREARTGRTEAEAEKKRLEDRKKLVEEKGTREDRLADLLSQEERVGVLRLKVGAASRAAIVAPLAEAARDRVRDRDRLSAEKDALLEKMSRNPEVGTNEPTLLNGKRDELTTELSKVREFESEGLGELRRLEGELRRLEGLGRELEDPDSDRNRSRAAAAERVEKSEAELAASKRGLLEIREARNVGMAAELADRLEDGSPCVVCGSTDHPSPATLPDGTPRFEKSDEEEAEQRVSAAEGAREKARESQVSIERELDRLKTEISTELETVRRGLTAAKAAEEGLLAGAATVEARAEVLEETIESIDETLGVIEKAESTRREAERALKDLEDGAAAQGFEDPEEAGRALIDPGELDRLGKEISDFDSDLNATRQRLRETAMETVDRNEVVDATAATETADAARLAHEEALARLTTASNRLTAFENRAASIPDLIEKLKPLLSRADTLHGLWKLANGDNRLKVQLSNYVLAARLKQVIAAANVRLGPMSGGRYQLVYEEPEGGQGQQGLGIRVFDSYISDERSVKTLSGGETFYASLSLALGLAEVIQMESGGKRIETLFVDEGFGTLDSGTLDLVMNEIENLRSNGRAVGLVSHVEELRNRIPAQIQVIPSRSGSRLQIVGV